MVCTCVGGIISVICRQDQKVILPKRFKKNAQVFIKFLNLFAVTFHISSVSPQGIEINQIDKAKSLKVFFADGNSLLHAVYGTVGMIGLCDSLAAENIVDLAYADHIQSCILKCIQGG